MSRGSTPTACTSLRKATPDDRRQGKLPDKGRVPSRDLRHTFWPRSASVANSDTTREARLRRMAQRQGLA
jgi:hypothetical protein